MATTRTRAPNKLTKNDIEILYDIVRGEIVSTKTMAERYFSHCLNPENAAYKKLRLLTSEKYGVIASTFSTSETVDGELRKHTHAWYMPPKCQRALIKILEKEHNINEIERFETAFKTFNKRQRFDTRVVHHETRLSYLLFSFEDHAKAHPAFNSCNWIRSSLGHELTDPLAVTATITRNDGTSTKKKYPINPDAIFWIRLNSGRYKFYLIEFENDSSRAVKYRDKKLIGYLAFYKQALFVDLCEQISAQYNLNTSHADDHTFQLLTISKSPEHMRRLFAASSFFPTDSLFLFSHFDAVLTDPFGSCWLSKKTFASPDINFIEPVADTDEEDVWDSYFAKYDDLTDTASAQACDQWIQHNLHLETFGVSLV